MRFYGFAGLTAAVLAASSIVIFAGRWERFEHSRHWVSFLGAYAAPDYIMFNLLAFIIPGGLIVALSIGLYAAVNRVSGPLLIAVCGVSLMAVGLLPLNLTQPVNIAHSVAVQVCGAAFSCGLVCMSPCMRRNDQFSPLAKATPIFLLLVLLLPASEILRQGTGISLEPVAQRFAFLSLLSWMAWAGWTISEVERGRTAL